MSGMYPFTVRFKDGTETHFASEAAHMRAIIRCGAEHSLVLLMWDGGMAQGCWRCLTTEVRAA